MFYESYSLVPKFIRFLCLLLLLMTAHLYAGSSDEEEDTSSGGSVRLKPQVDTAPFLKKKRHFTPIWSKKTTHRSSQEFLSLKANLELRAQQLPELRKFLEFGTSRGLLFRDKDMEKKAFFENLKTLYDFYLENFHILIDCEIIGNKKTQTFSTEIPKLKEASQQVFQSLKIIFCDAREDLEIIKSYRKRFSEEFKKGKEKETSIRSKEREEYRQDRIYTTVQVVQMIDQIYTQYHFFLKMLPTFRSVFEELLFMGSKIDFLDLKGKSKKRVQQSENSELFSIESELREMMGTLPGRYLSEINPLNAILSAHGENPVQSDPNLYEARVSHNQFVYLLEGIIDEHKEEEWTRKLEETLSKFEIDEKSLLTKIAQSLRDPLADVWKETSSSPSSSPGTTHKMEEPKRKNSTQTTFENFKRTLSRRKLSKESAKFEVEKSEEELEYVEKETIKEKMQALGAKLHRKNKKTKE
ncbi:MAG: hypothetical protein K2Y18_08670 [Alphaproteobacteria bacterium]|nr:hypothetical protein [Alphaproteobacteria bacterium]